MRGLLNTGIVLGPDLGERDEGFFVVSMIQGGWDQR